jgi:hypothetical protein
MVPLWGNLTTYTSRCVKHDLEIDWGFACENSLRLRELPFIIFNFISLFMLSKVLSRDAPLL